MADLKNGNGLQAIIDFVNRTVIATANSVALAACEFLCSLSAVSYRWSTVVFPFSGAGHALLFSQRIFVGFGFRPETYPFWNGEIRGQMRLDTSLHHEHS